MKKHNETYKETFSIENNHNLKRQKYQQDIIKIRNNKEKEKTDKHNINMPDITIQEICNGPITL